jgi:hypothetical protein
MRVAVLQSAYIPWRGYFDLIASVDLFVIYDDVQYSKGTWRNRNRVKTPSGLQWITVPVDVSLGQSIDSVRIAQRPKPWLEQHAALLKLSMGTCVHYMEAMEVWRSAVASPHELLSPLNVALLRSACDYLDIGTPIVSSSNYSLDGRSTDRLLQLLRAVGASQYISGPAGDAYLDKSAFAAAGIRLFYKSYDYPEYPQAHGSFAPAVSILDLIANCGKGAKDLIRSTTPDQLIVP